MSCQALPNNVAAMSKRQESGQGFGFGLDELARTYLAAHNDKRKVIADVHARYFGSELDNRSFVTGDNARIGATRFHDWLSRSTALA